HEARGDRNRTTHEMAHAKTSGERKGGRYDTTHLTRGRGWVPLPGVPLPNGGQHGERADGGGEDPGGEGQGRCAGGDAGRAGRRGAQGGAGLSRLSPAPLDEGSRSVLLLRAVQGRRRLRRAPQGAAPGRLPRAPREGRPHRRPARGRDLPLAHRLSAWSPTTRRRSRGPTTARSWPRCRSATRRTSR